MRSQLRRPSVYLKETEVRRSLVVLHDTILGNGGSASTGGCR